MFRYVLACSIAVIAGPSFANYGDIDAQIDEAGPELIVVSQPLSAPSHVVATADTCALPSEHIVSIPATFTHTSPTEMACLTE